MLAPALEQIVVERVQVSIKLTLYKSNPNCPGNGLFDGSLKSRIASLLLAAHGKDKDGIDFGHVTVQSHIAV